MFSKISEGCASVRYKMISFLKFLVSFLFGNTIEFKRIDSEGTITLQPAKEDRDWD